MGFEFLLGLDFLVRAEDMVDALKTGRWFVSWENRDKECLFGKGV